MLSIKSRIEEALVQGLVSYASSILGTLEPALSDTIAASRVEVPPRSDLGDYAFPVFPLAKALRKAPPAIAAELARVVADVSTMSSLATVESTGPYVNFRLKRERASFEMLRDILSSPLAWGRSQRLAGQRILVEFSSPNTNKPLHLGHLRNNALGEASSRILAFSGAEIKKVNLFNDRGIAICKSMIAWQRWGAGKTPQSEGMKGDKFVAELYVRFQKELDAQIQALRASRPELAGKDSDALAGETELGAAAQKMLRDWEDGDAATRELWKTMNTWVVDGILDTYKRTGVSFDWIQYEHETYLLGKSEALKGLERGIFHKRADGAVVVDLPWKDGKEDGATPQKVLLRADGTSIYVTQDLGTAVERHRIWPFDQAVYVVASEQDYHFKVLFHSLKALGYEWAGKLFHLSYGLVNLPTGRMKTREGTVVDADDLIAELASLSAAEMQSKGREEQVSDVEGTAQKIAVGALNYFLLQVSPGKDMIFNPEESLSFNGNTGPYLQYVGARISSILRKWNAAIPALAEESGAHLCDDQSWELLNAIAQWPLVVERAADQLDPSVVCTQLFETAKAFSRFYHEVQVLNAEDGARSARLHLVTAVRDVLKSGMELLNIPFLESM